MSTLQSGVVTEVFELARMTTAETAFSIPSPTFLPVSSSYYAWLSKLLWLLLC